MYLCTIATVTVHICTVTVAHPFIILLIFSLSCLWLLSFFLIFFLSCLCFFFLLSSPSGFNPHYPYHRPHWLRPCLPRHRPHRLQPHCPHHRRCWLRRNPRLHGPKATRQRGFGFRQLQWVLNGFVRQSRWLIMVARCSNWVGFELNGSVHLPRWVMVVARCSDWVGLGLMVAGWWWWWLGLWERERERQWVRK